MKVHAIDRSIGDFSWEKEEILELWNDILGNITLDDKDEYENQEYFIGPIVLVSGEKTSEKDKFLIVDGQQRMLTITNTTTS